MNESLDFPELEQVYDLVAQAIDEAGEGSEALFLSKLCICLAHRVGDLEAVKEAILIASKQSSLESPAAGQLPVEDE